MASLAIIQISTIYDARLEESLIPRVNLEGKPPILSARWMFRTYRGSRVFVISLKWLLAPAFFLGYPKVRDSKNRELYSI